MEGRTEMQAKTYSLNIHLIEGRDVLIASGNPVLRPGPNGSIQFVSQNYFVIHIMKDGELDVTVAPSIPPSRV